MGHPKLRKRTYKGPSHPWQKERIEEEKLLLNEFGLKNKKELWKSAAKLRKYTRQAKKLIVLDTPQAKNEKAQLVNKLSSMNLIAETAKIEDVLTITLKDILSRRLQTLAYRNKSAKSIRQARQFISHGHIMIGDKKITSPSYIVSKQEESIINFVSNSPLSNQDHPERFIEKEVMPKAPKKDKETSKKSSEGIGNSFPKKPKKNKEDKKTEKKSTKDKEEKNKEPKKEEKNESKK